MSGGPIFIAGVSYSGKTQLRLMLNAHADVHITRRTYFWRKHANRYGDLRRAENLKHALTALFASRQVQALNVDPEIVRREFESGEMSYTRLFEIIHAQNARAHGKARWGIQQSFVEWDADLIFADLPGAQMLHVVRAPLDRMAESLGTSPRRYGKVGWETALWRLSARWAVRNQTRYPQAYKLIHWETMLADPESVLAEVCAFLGVECQPGVRPSIETQAFSPESNDHYRLSPAERAFIQRWTRQEMASLGYPAQQYRLGIADWLSLALLDYPINSVGAEISNALRQRELNASKFRMEMRTG